MIFENDARASTALLTLGERLFRETNSHLQPRPWSNSELRLVAPHLGGSVLNISGWKDMDKEGGFYRNYFSGCSNYRVSNVPGASGATGSEDELHIDLEIELDPKLTDSFDVSYCHTVLEHVRDPLRALDNIAKLTRRYLILVVPFVQVEHYALGSFSDYFRFTPIGLTEHLSERGFEPIRVTTNRNPVFATYVFYFGVKRSPLSIDASLASIKNIEEISILPSDSDGYGFKPISRFGRFIL
jgi:SAM-dependent methyltransferase